MTTETSNAREWCPACAGAGWAPDADTADLVRCPDCAGSGRAEHSITVNEAAAPPPAAARGGVRGLVAKWRLRSDPYHGMCADELEAALAAEGVQAGEVSSGVTRKALANLIRAGKRFRNTVVETRGVRGMDEHDLALSAAEDALSQRPEARGVVDEAMVERACVAMYGSDWGTWHGHEASSRRHKVINILTAALTGERNG